MVVIAEETLVTGCQKIACPNLTALISKPFLEPEADLRKSLIGGACGVTQRIGSRPSSYTRPEALFHFLDFGAPSSSSATPT